MSYRTQNPLMEPIFFTPPGSKRLYKGGGSGTREATPEEKRLWGAQADSLDFMNTISKPNLLAGMNNLGVMANESMDGALGNRLAGMASADANQSLGMGLSAAQRGLERFGSTINPNALAAQMDNAGIQGALGRTNAMNQARMGAEDVKWQRNAALTGLASGQGNSAVSGMGALAGQIGANRQAANAADASSAQGLGMMGAYVMGASNRGPGMKNGGEISLANGGGLQMFQKQSMPSLKSSMPADYGSGDGPSTLQQIEQFAMPMAMLEGANAVRPYIGKGLSAIKGGLRGMTAPPPGYMTDAGMDSLAALPAISEAVPAIAPEFADAWMLAFLADGGLAKRKNMVPGGKVSGPGTETSDSIPARLSDGEFVLNAEAVKLIGKKKLNDLNNKGLQMRAAKGGR